MVQLAATRRNPPEYGRRSYKCGCESKNTYTGAEEMNKTTKGSKKNPAKDYLLRYRALQLKCAAIERAIRTAMDNATNTTVSLKEVCVQTSGGGDMMANAIVSVIDATRFLDEERVEAVKVMREIMCAIKSVPDETQQTVLIEKYINGRTLQEIQGVIHYEYRNTRIIHGKALWNVWQYMKKEGLCA